jgi:hypothetical protein
MTTFILKDKDQRLAYFKHVYASITIYKILTLIFINVKMLKDVHIMVTPKIWLSCLCTWIKDCDP